MAQITARDFTLAADAHTPCIGCGYDLFGCDSTGRCPECGQRVATSRRFLKGAWRGAPAKERLLQALGAWTIAAVCCGVHWTGISIAAAFEWDFGTIPAIVIFLIAPAIHGFATLWAVVLCPLPKVWAGVTRGYIAGHWFFGFVSIFAPTFTGLNIAFGLLLRDDFGNRHTELLIYLGVALWMIGSTIAGAGLTMLLCQMANRFGFDRAAEALGVLRWCLGPAVLVLIACFLTVMWSGVLRRGVSVSLFMLLVPGVLAMGWIALLVLLTIVRRHARALLLPRTA